MGDSTRSVDLLWESVVYFRIVVYRVVLDADGLIKLGKAEVLAPFFGGCEALIPEAVYEEAVIIGKLELYEDAFELEKVLKESRIRTFGARTNPRAGNLLAGVTALGNGERAALHLYHAEEASAILSDDRVLLRFLDENSIPYLTPANVIVRLVEVRRLSPEEGLSALDKSSKLIRRSTYEKAMQDLETLRGDDADE